MINKELLEKITFYTPLFSNKVLVGILRTKEKNLISESRFLTDEEMRNLIYACAEYFVEKGIKSFESKHGKVTFDFFIKE